MNLYETSAYILERPKEVGGGERRTFSVSANVTGTAILDDYLEPATGNTKVDFSRLRFWISFALRLGNKSGLEKKNDILTKK